MAQQAIALNKVQEELPFAADIGKSDDIELQEIMEKIMKGMENLIPQGFAHAQSPRPEQTAQEHMPTH